jgi:predicted anti-sigma-YlaC factor YlaD
MNDCREVKNSCRRMSTATRRNAAAIAAHLETCDACRALAHAQSVARTVLKARAAQLSPIAPPGLRTRIIAEQPRKLRPQAQADRMAWTGRLTAFAAAAMVVLTLGAVLLPVGTVRSTRCSPRSSRSIT